MARKKKTEAAEAADVPPIPASAAGPGTEVGYVTQSATTSPGEEHPLPVPASGPGRAIIVDSRGRRQQYDAETGTYRAEKGL